MTAYANFKRMGKREEPRSSGKRATHHSDPPPWPPLSGCTKGTLLCPVLCRCKCPLSWLFQRTGPCHWSCGWSTCPGERVSRDSMAFHCSLQSPDCPEGQTRPFRICPLHHPPPFAHCSLRLTAQRESG